MSKSSRRSETSEHRLPILIAQRDDLNLSDHQSGIGYRERSRVYQENRRIIRESEMISLPSECRLMTIAQQADYIRNCLTHPVAEGL